MNHIAPSLIAGLSYTSAARGHTYEFIATTPTSARAMFRELMDSPALRRCKVQTCEALLARYRGQLRPTRASRHLTGERWVDFFRGLEQYRSRRAQLLRDLRRARADVLAAQEGVRT